MLYTGDFAVTVARPKLFQRMVTAPPTSVDTVLLEGTHVRAQAGTDDQAPVATETDVEWPWRKRSGGRMACR